MSPLTLMIKAIARKSQSLKTESDPSDHHDHHDHHHHHHHHNGHQIHEHHPHPRHGEISIYGAFIRVWSQESV